MVIFVNRRIAQQTSEIIGTIVSEYANIIDLTSIFYYDGYIGHIMYSAEKDGL